MFGNYIVIFEYSFSKRKWFCEMGFFSLVSHNSALQFVLCNLNDLNIGKNKHSMNSLTAFSTPCC